MITMAAGRSQRISSCSWTLIRIILKLRAWERTDSHAISIREACSCPTSASFLSFAFGLQPLRPLQNFVLDFCFQVREIPIIAAVVSVFGKSLREAGVIFHTPPRLMI